MKQQPPKYAADREARVAAALRDNLRKRKEQERLRNAPKNEGQEQCL